MAMTQELYPLSLGEEVSALIDSLNMTQALRCDHCEGDVQIRNPQGFCDHLHYPEYCRVCQRMRKEKEVHAKA